MTNKKKILIETLHGSVAQLNELSSMTEGIDIYDDTGCVDTDFLIEAISCVSAFMDASNIVVQKISSLLAPDAPVGEKKKQADEGKKWNVEEILKHCTLENNILKLPQVQFNKKSYAEAKKWIEEAGGSWHRRAAPRALRQVQGQARPYRDPQAAPQGEADPRHRHQPHARGRGQDHHLRRPGRRAQQDRQEDHGLPA